MIPEGWTEVRLGDCARMRSGGTPITSVSAYYGGDISWASISDMSSSRKYLNVTERYLTDEGLKNSAAVLFPPQTLLYAMYASIGECCISTREMATSQAILGIECGESLNVEFLFYVLQSRRAEVVRSGQQGTQANLNAQMVRDMCIPMPAAPEQKAIAEALSDADALVESLDVLIAKKRDMKQAAMQHFFSRSLMPENENSLIRFGKEVSMKARIGWQGLTTAEYLVRGAFRLVTGTDIQGGAINWDTCWYVDKSRYEQDKYIQLRRDDVLVTKDGTIGKVGFIDSVPLPATLNSGVFVLRPVSDRIQARYLRHLMFSRVFGDFLDRLTAGSTITHLYQKDFETFTVVVPGVEEQRAIAEVLSDMDAEIDALVAQREKAELVKQGMMQELLSGRVRLA